MATIQDPPRFVPVTDGVTWNIANPWYTWLQENVTKRLNAGKTVTVPLAKITGGGTDGSLRFENGLLVEVTQPT